MEAGEYEIMVLFLGCCGTFGVLPLKFESGGDPALLEERLASSNSWVSLC